MRLHTLIIVLISWLFIGAKTGNALKRLEDALNNFEAYSYEDIHRLVVLDQIETYSKPIESIATRHVRSLNGLYDFCFDPDARGITGRFYEKPLEDVCSGGNFYRMPVPSAFNDILSNKTAKNYVGWMWYQTTIFWQPTEIPCSDRASRHQPNDWILQIESINYLSVIWISTIDTAEVETQLVGSHAGGHLPISMNISSLLLGRAREVVQLRLTVAVSNLLTANTIPSGEMINMTNYVGRPFYKFQPDFDFFNFAGIMGDVQLIRLPRYFIEHVEFAEIKTIKGVTLKICLNAPIKQDFSIRAAVEGCRGRVDGQLWRSDGLVECIVYNDLDEDCTKSMDGEVSSESCLYFNMISFDALSNCKHAGKLPDTNWPVAAGKRVKLILDLVMENDPNDGAARHVDTFEFKLERRANMSRVVGSGAGQLQGFGMHHEQLFSGRTMSLASIMKDLHLVKSVGANVIRTSHYPYSRAYLEACDELGVMVIAECPAVGLATFSDIKLLLHKQMLLEMMQRDQGHPSIVMWSLANEPQSQLPEARAYFKSLVQFARDDLKQFTIQADRLLTAAIAQSHNADTIGDLFDVLMINRYFGWYDCAGLLECIRHSLIESLTGWAAKYGRNKPLVLSEFGADTLAGLHSSTSEIFSEEYQQDLVVEYERVFDELIATNKTFNGKINFLGAMIWNFADFSTHESLLRVGGNKKGVFTQTREPKLVVESVKQIYSNRLKRDSGLVGVHK